jgi:hypothetical protein
MAGKPEILHCDTCRPERPFQRLFDMSHPDITIRSRERGAFPFHA